jgi:hypothetical protein
MEVLALHRQSFLILKLKTAVKSANHDRQCFYNSRTLNTAVAGK